MTNLKTFAAATALAGLAGCSTFSTGPDADLGEAVRNNIAVQTIDPEPEYEGAAPVMGDRPALAVKRYRTDKVEKPAKTSTSDVGRSSGGGTGGTPQN